eukprot:gene55379-23557_t
MIYQVPVRIEQFFFFGVLICIDDLLWCLALLIGAVRLRSLRGGPTDALVQAGLLAASTVVFSVPRDLEYGDESLSLNAALNSHTALLSLLVSGNFAELKM